MLQVTVIAVGNLKESYWRDAAAEYEKRLRGFCKPEIIQLREATLRDNPSDGEILSALEEEGKRILAAVPPRCYRVALCVEGTRFSSAELAKKLERAINATGSICFIIGSSFGLSQAVKDAADLQLSVSDLTFPHQMMRVLLLEVLYRSLNILKGTRYHK